MRKDELLTRGGTKGFPHPLEPVVTAFSLITLTTGGDKVGRKRMSAKRARTDVINSEFIRFMFNSTVDTLTIKVFLNCTTMEPLGFGTSHRY